MVMKHIHSKQREIPHQTKAHIGKEAEIVKEISAFKERLPVLYQNRVVVISGRGSSKLRVQLTKESKRSFIFLESD